MYNTEAVSELRRRCVILYFGRFQGPKKGKLDLDRCQNMKNSYGAQTAWCVALQPRKFGVGIWNSAPSLCAWRLHVLTVNLGTPTVQEHAIWLTCVSGLPLVCYVGMCPVMDSHPFQSGACRLPSASCDRLQTPRWMDGAKTVSTLARQSVWHERDVVRHLVL